MLQLRSVCVLGFEWKAVAHEWWMLCCGSQVWRGMSGVGQVAKHESVAGPQTNILIESKVQISSMRCVYAIHIETCRVVRSGVVWQRRPRACGQTLTTATQTVQKRATLLQKEGLRTPPA
jgi:hypothetical protein